MFHKLQYFNKTVAKTVFQHFLGPKNSVFKKNVFNKIRYFLAVWKTENGLNSTLYLEFFNFYKRIFLLISSFVSTFAGSSIASLKGPCN